MYKWNGLKWDETPTAANNYGVNMGIYVQNATNQDYPITVKIDDQLTGNPLIPTVVGTIKANNTFTMSGHFKPLATTYCLAKAYVGGSLISQAFTIVGYDIEPLPHITPPEPEPTPEAPPEPEPSPAIIGPCICRMARLPAKGQVFLRKHVRAYMPRWTVKAYYGASKALFEILK